MRVNRQPILFLLCVGVLHVIHGHERPNIVVLMADDLGIGDVGCFGNTTIKTPNIDRICHQGAKLTHFLAAGPMCSPSRAAFLTGRYPLRSRMSATVQMPVMLVLATALGLSQDEITFAEIAKQAGYSTGIIGKWHQGLNLNYAGDNYYNPLNQGFDYFYGLPLTNLRDNEEGSTPSFLKKWPRLGIICHSTSIFGFLLLSTLLKSKYIGIKLFSCTIIILCGIPQLFLWLITHVHVLNGVLMRNLEIVEQPVRLQGMTKRLVAEGEDFIQQRFQDGAPFLLYMSWLQVHTALHAGPEFQGRSKHGRYGDEVEEMDWSVGQILDTLDRLGMTNNTLVFFTSDHGPHLEERDEDRLGGHNGIFRGGKGQGGMEGGIRVPTAVMWPGHVTPGSIISEPISNMDVFPTIAAVVGQPLPSDRTIDGRNILPLITGQSTKSPHDFIFHYCTDRLHAVRWRPQTGESVWKVRYASPNWKPGTETCPFLCNCDGSDVIWHDKPLVFDITNDPTESSPLDPREIKYQEVMDITNQAKIKHLGTLKNVPQPWNLWEIIWKPHLQPCCNFPYCSCTDPKYP